jgi:hypothetical protein
MERGFIAAEVGDWEDIDYVVEDGDTVLVRFNV